jgi:hypothetical protein
MTQALASTAKAIGIGVGSLSLIAYLALWGGQRQVHLLAALLTLALSWRIPPTFLLGRVQRCLTRTMDTASTTRIYTSLLQTAKNSTRT